ncbi:cyclic nucleotide-binding protein [Marivirga tractuosa]|uniref:Transcriptional regulator, Crp/Fnr family n=1 Tax=Marivirga tractuosa (strain ATCC 23168 / DSM 4126 / NBRC 15989 / NCIMB 1408 / VKM B-1430 / H-43) TaxID=643867 RepID=E4TLS5_MARTH|nr:Crp/Fnr family transcriptional regulator [Marivirga tractuosa]ADR23354.1 transcriptional regulator, Crp/Fnr family [Marivirga tractuosa DSM 4126]BDD15972.1 cyclic nucleotide-binding protein [Marivirga tractuosa]
MSDSSQLWYFENVDLFNVLCPHKIKGLEDDHPMTKFKKDEFVYFPEQVSNHIYMIAEGRIKIGSYLEDGKESVKAILSKGEIFGELALTGEEKRQDFAQAMDSETIICPMTLDDMKNLMANNQPLSFKMMKLIGLRLRKTERRLESLVFKDARTRIIEFLRDEANEKGKKIGFEMMIPSHLTHKDIAALTGTSRQTVTTILNELREKNIINFDRRKILIRDMELLA